MNFTALSDGTYIENDIFFPQQQGRLHSCQWLDWQPGKALEGRNGQNMRGTEWNNGDK
jgi:hypothetical protein